METTRALPQAPGLLASLGLQGLSHLDAPILAALALETPLLLIGPHGTAKSALLERLATALQLQHRHYNASLISFDDLVGFPVPEGDGLRYLRTPATLWGAQSVFLDEISRCRPEVQNKLFSIVHERRVQGLALTDLRYRWAAMNPPASPDDDEENDIYIGSSPLDPALADRFGFVLSLPALLDLAPEARRAVIRSGMQHCAVPAIAVQALVNRCRALQTVLQRLHSEWITIYVSATLIPLKEVGLALSGRRAAMLAGNIAAVHAARMALAEMTLQGHAVNEANQRPLLADSALIALRNSLPQAATGRRIDVGVLRTLHHAAVSLADGEYIEAELAHILDEAHPVRRVGLAVRAQRIRQGCIPKATMSLFVSDALASLETQARWILAQELLPVLADLDCVDTPTLELLAGSYETQIRFETEDDLKQNIARGDMKPFNHLVSTLSRFSTHDADQVALGNLGSTLYAQGKGEAEPLELKAQQARLRELLQAEPADAR